MQGKTTTSLVWKVELTGWNLLIFESHKKSNALKTSYNRRQPLFYVKIYRDNAKCLWAGYLTALLGPLVVLRTRLVLSRWHAPDFFPAFQFISDSEQPSTIRCQDPSYTCRPDFLEIPLNDSPDCMYKCTSTETH